MSAQQQTPLNAVEQLAVIIRQHRVDRELTLHDVADRCGVKVSAARAWEHAELVPTSREWARLCNLVHRALRGHANVFQAARAQVTTPGDAAVDARKVATYIEQEPTRQDAVNVSAIAKELPSISDALSLGEALRRARVIEGMTQDEFGEIVGVVGTAVSAWECGHSMPVLENFDRLVQLVPEIERWRGECQVRPKPAGSPGNFGANAGRVLNVSRPTTERAPLQLAAPPLPEKPTVEGASIAYGEAMLLHSVAKRELQQYEDRLAKLRANVDYTRDAAERCRAQLDDAIAQAVAEGATP